MSKYSNVMWLILLMSCTTVFGMKCWEEEVNELSLLEGRLEVLNKKKEKRIFVREFLENYKKIKDSNFMCKGGGEIELRGKRKLKDAKKTKEKVREEKQKLD